MCLHNHNLSLHLSFASENRLGLLLGCHSALVHDDGLLSLIDSSDTSIRSGGGTPVMIADRSADKLRPSSVPRYREGIDFARSPRVLNVSCGHEQLT